MHLSLNSRFRHLFLVGLLCSFLQSCFTGVEGTGKINLSKKDEAILSPTIEESLLSDCKPEILKEWNYGKQFIITDEKFKILIESDSYIPQKGDTIFFQGTSSRASADGSDKIILSFTHGGDTFIYPLEKLMEEAMQSVTITDIPFLIEIDLLEKIKERLVGKKLWTKSALWYDDSLNYLKGKKFLPVNITGLEPGNAFFPFKVNFSTPEGLSAVFLMSLGNSGNDSRSFNRLFSLSDPKQSYKHISRENWEAIQNESLRIGMSKEECRLSRGNPSETDSGHNYSNTMEIWMYPNGSFLRFIDGVLVEYK